jgi:cation:H+ antiporter
MDTQTLLLFLAGLLLLIGGAELLVRGAAQLSVAIGISPLVVGLTVVAYGTSAPELAVVIQSMYATPPQPDLVIGNVVGSNISNVLLVLGLSALVAPLIVSKPLVRTSVPVMIAVSLLVWWMALDSQITRAEGSLLFLGAIGYSALSIVRSRRAVALRKSLGQVDSDVHGQRGRKTVLQLVSIAIGLALLVVGARWLVDGATAVARLLQVSELVIGLTVVAVGTSLPEIATSMVAGLRGQRDIAVGNVVGSNIFNLLLVLGCGALLAPAPVRVQAPALNFDIPVMVAVALACLPIFYSGYTISRGEGLLLIAYYAAYAVFLFLQATRHSAIEEYTTVMRYFILPLSGLVLIILAARFWLRRRRESGTEDEAD